MGLGGAFNGIVAYQAKGPNSKFQGDWSKEMTATNASG